MDFQRARLLSPLVLWKFWFVCIQLLLVFGSTRSSRKSQQQATERRRLQAFIDNTNNPRHAPAVASFLVSDGSWVDCIPIEGQIAAHHPTLQDITSKWSHLRYIHLNPGAAPRETHEYAVTGLPLTPQSYSGAYAIFSVNSPALEAPQQDFSLSQVWIIDGHWSDDTLATIEVGWQTYPLLHPNDEPLAPHLFTFWTNNAYNYSGCYNLDCPGFVQYDRKWVIGGAMPYYTTLAENRKQELEVEIEVLYDPTQLLWWLYSAHQQ